MTTTNVKVAKTYNTGNYENTRIEMEFVFNENELQQGELTKGQFVAMQEQLDFGFAAMMEARKSELTPKHEKWSKVLEAYKAGQIKLADICKAYRVSDEIRAEYFAE